MESLNNIVATRQLPHLLLGLLLTVHGLVDGFTTPLSVASTPRTVVANANNDVSSSSTTAYKYEPVFDFSDRSQEAVNKFDRIDDAIMGGISTSSIRAAGDDSTGESFASWSGVCRTDGGGFCGTRTLPFRDGVPLKVVDNDDENKQRDGFYLKVRLASDNEPERRVWKLTTRVENVQRSEQLYQAMFEIPKQDGESGDEWKTIQVPFDTFIQVRGPRIVENGPPLNVTGGLFQVGMTMSKFQIASNTTEFNDFRPGYFELQIQEIGVYGSSSSAVAADSVPVTDIPVTLTKEQAQSKRPVALKILGPVLKLFFSEKRNRQKSAVRILKNRGYGRWDIIKFGFKRKVNSKGMVAALAQTLGQAVGALARVVAFWTLKIALFYPFRTIRRTMKALKKKKSITGETASA
mmetsp:Transcript_24300/g.51688  ORF Transcript_24300/g.51688 Transcript_24300/m.51688 type:complete len:407 (+) Transcript_24300:121-1341(+)